MKIIDSRSISIYHSCIRHKSGHVFVSQSLALPNAFEMDEKGQLTHMATWVSILDLFHSTPVKQTHQSLWCLELPSCVSCAWVLFMSNQKPTQARSAKSGTQIEFPWKNMYRGK
jgi:hypothetical protein